MAASKVRMGQRARLVKKLLVVAGLSRAGKFLACNLLNGLKNVEPVQYPGTLEHIPFMHDLGLIEKRTAEELLHHEIDLRTYEGLIGRILNHRRSDKSSIFNVAGYREYLKRAENPDEHGLLMKYLQRRSWSPFVVHEMPNSRMFYETFPEAKVVMMRRSPIDLVYEWATRYGMMHWGEDPRMVAIPMEGKRELLPWFVHARASEYEAQKNPVDRTIIAMDVLATDYARALKKLPAAFKKRTRTIRYEDILRDPRSIIRALCAFLGTTPHPDMGKILKREKLPNPHFVDSVRAKRLAYIKKRASKKYFNRLVVLERGYNKTSK